MQSLLVIVSENEEEFDFSISNVVAGVHKSNTLDVLEEISYFRSDLFTLFDLELPTNSYMFACTDTQNFVEEGENCSSTISVGHLEHLFCTIGSDMTLFGSIFKFWEPPILLVHVLINFGVNKTSTKSLFQNCVGDLMSVLSHEFSDIIFCESLDILEDISFYGYQYFIFHGPRTYLPLYLITCSSAHSNSKYAYILHSPRHLLLTPGDDFTSNGSIFKDTT